MGNTNPKLPTWDRKTESWVYSNDADTRNSRLKSKHLSNNPDTPVSHDEEENDDDNDDLLDADGMPQKRRKTNLGLQERIFETKKWSQIAPAVAEKLPEPTYLSPRRPGMESLYGGAYKATNGFGLLGIHPGSGSGAIGYDLGDGSGLGNAAGVLGITSTPQESAPPRKNMPPKRKKKKIGGPGRKKTNPNPTGNATGTGSEDVTMTDTPTGENEQPTTANSQTGENQIDEAEGSGSESEGEGSEEGEIDEGGKADSQATSHTTKPPLEPRQPAELGIATLAEAEVNPEVTSEITEASVHPPAAEITIEADMQQATPPIDTIQGSQLLEEPSAEQTVETTQAPEDEPLEQELVSVAEEVTIIDSALVTVTEPEVDIVSASATPAELPLSPGMAIEPEFVLEQLTAVEELSPAISQPALAEVTTVEAVTPAFELPQEEAHQTEKVSTEESTAQDMGEVDLLGGLEAAVDKEVEAE